MAFSYSFHISAKSHAVTNVGKIGQVGKHNLRAYEGKDYDRNLIETVVGTDNLLADMKRVYHEEFDQALEKYNEGKRADRQIDDYMTHVSDSRSDVGVEIIIQVGDEDFWKDKSMAERKLMRRIFEEQIEALQKHCPNFKIANATIHYDEKSPHMHVVGVPVAEGYKKGMGRQCAKTKVFTTDSLSALQNAMRADVERSMQKIPSLFAEMELKAKEKGRNKDIPKQSLKEYYDLQSKIKELKNDGLEIKKTQAKEIRKAVAQLPKQIETAPTLLNKDRVTVDIAELDKLEQRAKFSTIYEKNALEMENKAKELLSETNAWASEKIAEVKNIEREASRKLAEAKREHAKADLAYKRQIGLNHDLEALKRENEELTKSNDSLFHENYKLKAEIEELKSSFKDRLDKALEEAKKPYLATIKKLKQQLDHPKAKEPVALPEKLKYKGGVNGRGFYDELGKFYGDLSIKPMLEEKGVKILDPYNLLSKSL